MYTLQFTEDEINLVWSILSNGNIVGKFAPTLTAIFEKMQSAVQLDAVQQQQKKISARNNKTDNSNVKTLKTAAE